MFVVCFCCDLCCLCCYLHCFLVLDPIPTNSSPTTTDTGKLTHSCGRHKHTGTTTTWIVLVVISFVLLIVVVAAMQRSVSVRLFVWFDWFFLD